MRLSRMIGVVAGVLVSCGSTRGEEARTDGYGDPLPEHAVMRLGTVRFRQPQFAVQVAFSPDGQRLASIASDGKLRTWEVPSGKPVARTEGTRFDGYGIEALAYSLDGKLIAAEGPSCPQLLDPSTGGVVRNVGARINACGIALSADGAVLAATDFSMHVYAWDTSHGKRLLDVKAYELNERPTLALSADGKRLWTFLRGKGARLWNLESGSEEAPARPEMKEAVAAAFADHGRCLAMADEEGVVRVYENDHEPVELGKLDGGVVTLVFLQDGDTLSAIGEAGVLARWSLTTRARQKDLSLQSFGPFSRSGYLPVIAVSRDGRHVARAGAAIRLWDAGTGHLISPVEGGARSPTGMCLSPDEQYVATGNEDGSLHLWSLATGECVGRYSVEMEDAWPNPVGFSATGEELIVNTHEDAILVLRVPDLSVIRSIKAEGAHDFDLLDGGRLAVVAPLWERGLRLIDMRDGSVLMRPEGGEGGEGFGSVVVSPDQTLVAWEYVAHTEDRCPEIYVNSAQTGRPLWELDALHHWGYSYRFSPDSAYILVEDGEGETTWWNMATGQREEEAPEVEGDWAVEVAVDFSDDGVITVRRIDDHEVAWKVDPASGEIGWVRYSHDGRRLITPMGDTTVLVWELPGPAVAPPPTLEASLDELWTMLGSSNAWDVSRASATLAVRGDEAAVFLGGRVTPPPAEARAPSSFEWTPEGLARLRGVWALGQIGTLTAREALQALATGESREARAARSLLDRLRSRAESTK